MPKLISRLHDISARFRLVCSRLRTKITHLYVAFLRLAAYMAASNLPRSMLGVFAKTPTDTQDSLRAIRLVKILIAVREDGFDGAPIDRDIYLDNPPIMKCPDRRIAFERELMALNKAFAP